eukprot:GHVR01138934.1.p1 GENE.GHVR01138934.1~~GHVR01138934.1.p1  ORF type:complete len:214 (-),score=57.59 GHVR01138934.1:172-813(-)
MSGLVPVTACTTSTVIPATAASSATIGGLSIKDGQVQESDPKDATDTNIEGEVISLERFEKTILKLHCDICDKDICGYIRVACCDCPNMDMCVDCFSKGEEKGDHLSTHRYTVVESLNYPLFHIDWTVEDELQFIQLIGKCGYGHWTEIAEQMSSPRAQRADYCKQHYNAVYLDSPYAPLPDHTRMVSSYTKDTNGNNSTLAHTHTTCNTHTL